MSKHPYPDHVVEAVAEAMGRSRTGEDWGRFKDYFIEHTHVALQALWDASRINSREELDALPDGAIVHSDNNLFTDFPAHVIYWGDTDE